jgi:hypothetical protein
MNTPLPRPDIEELRARIRRLEGAASRRALVLPFGIKAIDRHLPGGGLALGALHEVAGGGNGTIHGAAAALFAAGIAARTRGKVLWCLTRPDLFAPALAQAGLVPDRVIYVEAGDEKSVLICFEEGLRHGGLGAVVAEVARLSLTASRRDALTNRVGEHHLYRFAPVASDVPERSVQRIAPAAPDTGEAWRDLWPDFWPRPARLLPRPEPIETLALLPDHPPVSFTWRGIRRRVTSADGPARIFGEWWKRDAELSMVRDYFQVEDEAGERFWIYRSGDGEDATTGPHRWFLAGIFG